MSAQRTDTGRNQKKRTLAVAAIILLLILLSGGTYAWFHMISALNEFEGNEKNVVLHDDYDKEQTDQDGYENPLEYNKDVYVENTGAEPLFIRIRLDEYMEIGDAVNNSTRIVGNQNADRADVTTWDPHKYDQDTTDYGECLGTYQFHEYWEWEMGGAPIMYTPAAADQKNKKVDRYEGEKDNLDKNAGTNGTTQQGNLVTMKEYTAKSDLDKIAYIGWILDEDGWAYWSQKLKGNEATGLLLNSVTLKDSADAILFDVNYYYGINVVMEAADETDVDTWINGDAIKEEERNNVDSNVKDAEYNYTGPTDGTAAAATPEAAAFLKLISDNYN